MPDADDLGGEHLAELAADQVDDRLQVELRPPGLAGCR
jgi:hypothetical protein